MKPLVITLKQHTPLIHFQHDQDGATLRATEVKPKLDRFILTKLGENYGNFSQEEMKACDNYFNALKKINPQKIELTTFEKGYACAKQRRWLVGKGEHPALDYKMKFDTSKSNKIKIDFHNDTKEGENSTIKHFRKFCDSRSNKYVEFPLLLSNMGGKEDKDELIDFILYDNVIMNINSFHEEIIKTIQEELPYFFALNNFGQRSTKGFGSFHVMKIGDKEISWTPEYYYNDDSKTYIEFSTENAKNEFNRQLIVFQVLDFYWKALKSGINYTKLEEKNGTLTREHKDRYIKSYLWTYLDTHSNKSTWEKKFIKKEFCLFSRLPSDEFKKSINDDIDNPHFARALLGCPEKFEYPKRKETISIKNSDIDRIPSPIILKPILDNNQNASVYVLFNYELINEINSIKNKQFIFRNISGIIKKLDIQPHLISYPVLIKKFHKEKINRVAPRDFRWNNYLGQNSELEELCIEIKTLNTNGK